MRLFDLLERSGIARPREGLADFDVRMVVADSKAAGPGAVFVAIRGTKADGNAFIPDAARKGAGLVITDREDAPAAGCPALRVPSARLAYALLNHHLHGAPTDRMKTVAVTGTNGKTTTAFLVQAIARSRGEAGIVGTIRYGFGQEETAATHTTPDARDLHALFARMAAGGCWAVVMEASSHALDQDRLAGIRFDAAVFTNLTQDHLDYHRTMEEYFRAKARLFGMLRPGGAAVLNADDRWAASLKGKAKRTVLFGIDAAADLRARNIRSGLDGSSFEVEWEGRKVPFTTSLFGRHNVYNILGAVGAAAAVGIRPEDSARMIAAFPGVPGRLERVDAGQDFTLFVDYAHTDDGLRNVLSTLRPFAKEKLLVLFGCGGDRDRGKRPKMAQVAEEYADFAMLTSDNPRFEDPRAILKEVEAGFSPGFRSFESHPDREKAIRTVLLKARKGDVVLLAGKGHEDYQVIGDKKVPFNDKEEALRVLRGL